MQGNRMNQSNGITNSINSTLTFADISRLRDTDMEGASAVLTTGCSDTQPGTRGTHIFTQHSERLLGSRKDEKQVKKRLI